MVSIGLLCTAAAAHWDGWRAQKGRGPQCWGLWWGWSSHLLSLEVLLSAEQTIRALVASGPDVHISFNLCIYVYVYFTCYTREPCTLSWRSDIHRRTNQKINRQQTPPKLKHHLQHKNTRQLPRPSSPHPPHQWGDSVAEHDAPSISKSQHPAV